MTLGLSNYSAPPYRFAVKTLTSLQRDAAQYHITWLCLQRRLPRTVAVSLQCPALRFFGSKKESEANQLQPNPISDYLSCVRMKKVPVMAWPRGHVMTNVSHLQRILYIWKTPITLSFLHKVVITAIRGWHCVLHLAIEAECELLVSHA